MINNDTSSTGSRTVRPDKPAAPPAKHVAVPVENAPSSVDTGIPDRSGGAVTPAATVKVSSASELSSIVKISEVESVTDGQAVANGQPVAKEEAQVLNEEQKKEVAEAIFEVEAFMQDNQRTLNFEMAEKDNRVIITVIDQATKEVIRQIPPDDLVRMSDAIKSGDPLANGGILIQSKA
jgi:flagellar protein FlaG